MYLHYLMYYGVKVSLFFQRVTSQLLQLLLVTYYFRWDFIRSQAIFLDYEMRLTMLRMLTHFWVTLSLPSDPFKPFIIFSNRHEIRRIELHKGEFSVLVPGLRNTIALDFHLNESTLYWTDVVEDKIYRGKLSENGGEAAS